MRTGFLVDATCDLPDRYFSSGDVMVMPITVRIGDHITTDQRNDEVTLNFLDSHIAAEASAAETSALTVDQIRDLFLKRLVVDYDYVFCLTVTRERSPIYEHATQASFSILNEYRPVREAAGKHSPFSLRVLDTGSLFAGQGVPVAAGVAMNASSDNAPMIRAKMEQIARSTQAYAVAPDLYYLRSRARAKGDRSVGLVSAMLGSALDIKPILHCNQGVTHPVAKVRGFEAAVEKLFIETANEVDRGLTTPQLTLSYGGSLEKLREFPGYDKLTLACHNNGVELLESLMSLTGIINLGSGAVSLGFACDRKPTLS
ncbi:MAG: DegV family protein [Proteobacteria bacterium]|nr:DegV family protein [Pseudomonadota bacterium]